MQNKTLAYWIVGIVGVVLIVLIVRQIYVQDHGSQSAVSTTGSAPQVSPSATSTTPTTVSGNSATGSGAASAAYQAALAIYQKNGYRVEISECHGIPGKLTVTQGQKYMLDNRDNKAHTIKVGPYSYSLPAYGYQIVTAEVLGLNNVTCDGGGAAQINIEK